MSVPLIFEGLIVQFLRGILTSFFRFLGTMCTVCALCLACLSLYVSSTVGFRDMETGRWKLQPGIWPVSYTFFRNPLVAIWVVS